jgi:hypothetical protein
VGAPAAEVPDDDGLLSAGAGIAAGGAVVPDDDAPDAALEGSVAWAYARFAKAITAEASIILWCFNIRTPFRKSGTWSDVARKVISSPGTTGVVI